MIVTNSSFSDSLASAEANNANRPNKLLITFDLAARRLIVKTGTSPFYQADPLSNRTLKGFDRLWFLLTQEELIALVTEINTEWANKIDWYVEPMTQSRENSFWERYHLGVAEERWREGMISMDTGEDPKLKCKRVRDEFWGGEMVEVRDAMYDILREVEDGRAGDRQERTSQANRSELPPWEEEDEVIDINAINWEDFEDL